LNGLTYTKMREGCTLTAQLDRGGNYAIGWGHNSPMITADTVWTQEQADNQVACIDYPNAQAWAASDVGAAWSSLDTVRQAALVDMAYELGKNGLSQFHNMLSAVRQGLWESAHDACLASDYAEQVPGRAAGAAYMLLTGEWPSGFGA